MGFICIKLGRVTLPLQIWALVMIVISVFSCLIAGLNSSSLFTLLNVVQVFLIGFVTFGYLNSREKMLFFFASFVAGGLILTLRLLLTTPFSVFLSFERLGESIGYNANDVGDKAMIAALSCVFLIRLVKNNLARLSLLFAFVILLAIVLFSGSRKDLLGLMLGVFIVYTFGLKKKRYLVISLVILFLLSFVLYRIMMTNESLYLTIGRRFETLIATLSGGSEQGSIDIRKVYISRAWELIANSYFIGIGLGQFAVVSGYGVYCHCDYLEVMCSFGLIGFLVYYSPILISVLRIAFKKRKTALDHSVFSLAVVILFVLITMVMYTSAYSIIILSLIAFQSRSIVNCNFADSGVFRDAKKERMLLNRYLKQS